MLPAFSRLSTQPTSGFAFGESDDKFSTDLMCCIVNVANAYHGTDEHLLNVYTKLNDIEQKLCGKTQSHNFYVSAMSAAIMGCAPNCEGLLKVIAERALRDGRHEAVVKATLRAACLRKREFYNALCKCVEDYDCNDFQRTELVKRTCEEAESMNIDPCCVHAMERQPAWLLLTFVQLKQTQEDRLRKLKNEIETTKKELSTLEKARTELEEEMRQTKEERERPEGDESGIVPTVVGQEVK